MRCCVVDAVSARVTEGRFICAFAIAAMAHLFNPQSSQPVRLHPKMSYLCFASIVAGPFAIDPGESLPASRRLIAFDGVISNLDLDALFYDFALTRLSGLEALLSEKNESPAIATQGLPE